MGSGKGPEILETGDENEGMRGLKYEPLKAESDVLF